MKLKQQIILLTGLSLLIPALLIATISIYKINSRAQAEIKDFREYEFSKLKKYLKHVTDVAYGMIETRHQDAQKLIQSPDSTISIEYYRDEMMEQCHVELSKIRFDAGEGYFWVTNNQEPFPFMLMHAERPNLKGVQLSDATYNVEKYERKNIYQARAKKCNVQGDAYVEYTMKKPGTKDVANKISYSRLYKPLGWIVSTGYYTDQIDAIIHQKKDALSAQIQEIAFTIFGAAILLMGGGMVIAFYFSNRLTKAILEIKEKLKELSLGHQTETVASNRKDEIGEMTQSLNGLVEGLRTYTSFAKEIGQGNLEHAFEPSSEEDVLGNELLDMRNNLVKAEGEKALREWSNGGLALMGEVLRKNNNDTRVLAEQILISLIKYLKMNQGAFFLVVHDENKGEYYLEQVALYAFERKKFLAKRLDVGQGLVGQCYLECRTIYLTAVPSDYITITSGLGEAPPNVLLLVPLVNNDIVYGVIEMASFKKLENHEIAFVEKVAESIASTVSTVQVNEKTKQLLGQSQQMSEEMKAQEEELRQNQEELQATQEQMRRRQVELEEENERLKLSLNKGD